MGRSTSAAGRAAAAEARPAAAGCTIAVAVTITDRSLGACSPARWIASAQNRTSAGQ
ncbi:hypothetical protein ACH4ND_32815 [Streptomyces sp. NPDC017179]|uniref:hypothetical protein n=1 Tax=Streptomyces sp. NPDC017179 TaxID=3364979 RepID=UPI00379BA23B